MVEISPEHSLDRLREDGYEDDIEETPEEPEDLVVDKKMLPLSEQELLVDTEPEMYLGLPRDKINSIREVWDKYKGEYSPKYIFLTYLKDYFDVPQDGVIFKNKEWFRFSRLIGSFKKEEINYTKRITAANLSDEEIEEINETNAKELVVLLQNTITQYQKKPETFKKLSFGDISKLYQIIKQIQGASERLELQRNKLKLEAAKTFLPYTRMDMGQLTWAQNLINKGIDQLKKNNAKKLPASESGEGGEQQDVE